MNKLYKLLKILLMAFAVISLGKSLFGCIDVYAADASLQLAPKSITINVNNQNLTYSPELNPGWAGYNVYTFTSSISTDWESANIIYTYNNLASNKICTQSNGVATVQGKFIAGTGALGTGVNYINEDSGNITACSFKVEGAIGTFTCNNVHLNDGFSFVNMANPGSRLGITQSLDITCGEMTTGQAVDTIINNNKENTDKIIEEENETQEKLEDIKDMEVEAEKTRKGIWETIKNLPSMFLDMLLSIFIPKDMDFINNFVDSIESKLGFIASIPMQFIEFVLNLASASWEEVTSISFPSIEVFGYSFWNSQEIDLSEAINIFKPFKYVTDVIAVCLFSNTLLKWWQNFTGGGQQ